MGDVFIDCSLQFGHACENASAQPLRGDVTKEPTVNLFSPKHSCASMSSGVFRHAQVIKDQAGVAVELGHFFSDAGFLVANEVEYTHGKAA